MKPGSLAENFLPIPADQLRRRRRRWNPGVGVAGDPRKDRVDVRYQCAVGLRAAPEPNGRTRLLDRLRLKADILELVESSAIGHAVTSPKTLNDLQVFIQAHPALLTGNSHEGEFLLVPTGAHAENRATA